IRGLLTPAGKESLRVLGIVLTDDIFHLNPAMPVALPFLIGLAADPHTCARDGLVDLLVLTAELSLPIESEDDRFITLFGTDDAHPERAGCKAAFAEHADALLALLEDDSLTDVLTRDHRSALRAAITTS
ncbi:MAG TPA: hypothetical protein VGP70_20045, partial [Actinomadura sp.]|nr:hypothetical protein [Actinomadura sp.]